MRRSLLASLLLLLTVAGTGLAQAPAEPDAPDRLLHLGHRAGGDSLRLVDPLTLAPRSRKIRSFKHAYGGVLSPDRRRLARGTAWGERSRIQVIDLARWREERVLTLGRHGPAVVEWPAPDALIVLLGEPHEHQQVAVVDPATGAVRLRRTLRGRSLSHHPVKDGVAFLSAPQRGVGPARLVVARSSGALRTVVLERIVAGHSEGAPRRVGYRHPGLAVDPAGERAYVVAAGEPLVAEVELASGQVTYREPAAAASGAAPAAGAGPRATAAKGDMRVWAREAAWFGTRSIAVTGFDGFPTPSGMRFPPPIEPHGLRLIDTGNWTIRTLNERTMQVHATTDRLLAHGTTWRARSRTSASTGLFGYGEDGRQAFARFRGREVVVLGTHGRRTYVWVRQDRALHVLDLRDGRTLRKAPARARDLPVLLSSAP